MLRHVMVCLEDKPSNEPCRSLAVHFASGYRSSLFGLYVRQPAPAPIPVAGDGIVPPYASPWSAEEYEKLVDAHEARENEMENRVLEAFVDECLSREVTSETLTRTGDPVTEILAAAQATDLVVLGRGEHDDSVLGSVAGSLIRKLGKPVLLGGAPGAQLRPLLRFAVAYDGTHGADRTLAAVADVCAAWRGGPLHADLISVATDGAQAVKVLAPAERYLRVYGIRCETHIVSGPPAASIVETAGRLDVDVLAMGAYGHWMVREVVLGSTTQSVIARWPRPMLLCR